MNNYQPITSNPRMFFKKIAIIHVAMLAGQVLFGAVVFFITLKPVFDTKPGNDPLFYMAPLMIVFGMVVGSFLYKQQVAKLADKPTLTEKLMGYQAALIIRFALAEGPALFSIVCFMLTGNLFYLLCTGINVLYFIWIRPTKQKMEDDLKLTYEDKIELAF